VARGLHLRGETHAITVRHLVVGDEHVERRAGGLRILQLREGLRARGSGRDIEAHRLKLPAEHAPIGWVVVHHEHALATRDHT